MSDKIYSFEAGSNQVDIFLGGKRFLTLPASASVNNCIPELKLSESSGSVATYESAKAKMIFEFLPDSILVSYGVSFDEDTPVYESRMFKSADSGIKLADFDRAFTSQPRNNNWDNMDYFNHLPDISLTGYFIPATFNFSIGNPDAWVSFGLLDIPDTSICKMDEDYSFLVESCGGNKVIKKGEVYRLPQVIITFPENEFQAVSLFRQKLIEHGKYTPQKPKFSEIPSWWKNPFVCTYGDQMLEHKVGPYIDEKWVTEIVDLAENDWGLKNINLIIDDSWQHYFSFEPKAEESRFPDMRKFIDSMHERGHHVLLWNTPMFENVGNGFTTRAQKLGMISSYRYADTDTGFGAYLKELAPESYAFDYTSDNARQFIKEVCEVMFGSDEGQYNADGVKLDFMACPRNPATTNTYSHPERGIGATELMHFYRMFRDEAKKVKPDVIIDATVGDPRFEEFIDFNRMHDTHCGTIEKEIRANLSVLACPDMPIDSDGALMFTSWLKTHYTSAAVYSVPSMYYMKKMHDFATTEEGEFKYKNSIKSELSTEEKHQMGVLLSMTKYRPDGVPTLESYGNWSLKDGNTVNAISQNGQTVVYYPTDKTDTGYIFTWQDETIILPLHGRKFSCLEPKEDCKHMLIDYARDRVILHLEPGKLYTFKNIDDGTSIDRIFRDNIASKAETEVDYVND